MKILFLCVGNSARSQIAEGLAKNMLPKSFEIVSAGSNPSNKVHPNAISCLDEIGIDKTTKRTIVAVNEKYFRPAEVESLLGDATKAKEKLGWEPKTTFKQLVEDMCIYGQ